MRTLPDVFTPGERERELLARIEGERLRHICMGHGQLAMGLALANKIIYEWLQEPPELHEQPIHTP